MAGVWGRREEPKYPGPDGAGQLVVKGAKASGGDLVIKGGATSSGNPLAPQDCKDVSSDPRKGLSSLFAWGKRQAEREAFQQAHMTPGGTPGVITLGLVDERDMSLIAGAEFNWEGRKFYTDSRGVFKYVDRDYFQTITSLENERQMCITAKIPTVVGQRAEAVIALYGYEFYAALRMDPLGPNGPQAKKAQDLYKSYLTIAGIAPDILKERVLQFAVVSDACASPEIITNYSLQDPEWQRAYQKLTSLLEYHPTPVLFDKGPFNPLDVSGKVYGDTGAHNKGPIPPGDAANRVRTAAQTNDSIMFPDSNR